MGRPERPVDPRAGAVQWLAHELRELRRTAGSPPYRTMAEAAGFSATTLSQAAAGERLPSLAVVQGYARACGGDPDTWAGKWEEAEAETARDPGAAEDAPAPYRGLTRFEMADRDLFFGRDRVTDAVNRLVCDHRFAVLFGPSGSGKSSLLRAGLIPRLRDEIAGRSRPAALRVLTPGPTPATTYGHLLETAPSAPENWVVVDQFEEVFTLCRDAGERARFIDLLLAARDAGSGLRVLVAVRADFYARCAEHRELADALRGAALLLGPMTAEELREAVVGPAQARGCMVERTLTARLVEEVLDEPGGLPMLSHALLETWRRRRGRLLTLAGYEAAGGVRGAVAATADEVYDGLLADQARAARHLLLRMVVPGQGTPDTRRPLTRAELAQWADPAVPVVVERLTRARLLTSDEDGVQLAHEALISCWPRLHGWIEEDRERLRHHRTLAEAARAWLEHDRDPGALYRGNRLARAAELFPDPAADPALTEPERDFLTAALAAQEAERRAAARIGRRHRVLTVSLSAVLAVALLTGFVVFREYADNRRQRTENAARRVADIADALRTTDPRTALRLGVAAWRIAELPETRRALLGSLAQPETDTFTDPTPGDEVMRLLTDDGRTLISADGASWRSWDVVSHRRTGSGRVAAGTVSEVGASARFLGVTEGDGLRLWDTAAGRWAGGSAGRDVGEVRFTADGRSYLAVEGDRLRLRSVTDGRVLFEARAPDAALTAVNADGTAVAACSGGAPRVWDTATGRVLPGAWQRDRVCGTASPLLAFGGHRLAAATATGLRIWDTATGRKVADLYETGLQYASFRADGAFVATADRAEIRVWRLSDPGAPVFRHELNNQYLYGDLVWDRDGRTLRYLEGGTAHTLDLGAAVTSAWRATPAADVRLSPDGRSYATVERVGDHYVFRLRATSDNRVLHTFPPVTAPVSSDPATPTVPADTLPLMAFGPTGTRFVYGVSAPGRDVTAQPLRVWDVTRERAVTSLDLPGGAVLGLALGAGGDTLYAVRATAIGEYSDEVWDLARHRRTAVLTGVTGAHLAVGPDGRLLVGEGAVLRPPSRRSTAYDLVQGGQIGAQAFTGDGSLLAVGDQTGRIALWDGTLGRREGVLRNVFPTPLGTTPEGVSALAFSPDGGTLAVGGDGGSLQLWDVATQQPLSSGPLTTPGEALTSLAFSADGRTLYAGSAHVPLQRYTVDPELARTRVCARTGNAELTRAQWRTYAPDEPYRRIC
ncbi:hypothetical protein ACIRU8_38460 [Streptomyces sp. NPDC101175]|uniref:nSTAND1 domain-containing NTPase n=1 Tax=Streptomyces sp. NPDC101175 TaxID=3366123 RepID=UPI003836F7FF